MSRLKKIAEQNTTVKKKKALEEEHILKEGTPIDHSVKHSLPTKTIGLSKGITKNMGDFESLRVDTWLVDTIQEGETVEEAFMRLNNIIDATLVRIVEKTLED